jgi:hypothetical protein
VTKSIKCTKCKRVIKEEPVRFNNKNYHAECREEIENRNSLIEYICELYGTDRPSGMILKQIKDFQEEYDYKLKGMELALRYFYETLDNKVRENDGIGIILYVYEEAKRHYIKQMKIAEAIENMESNEEEITVHINKNITKRKSKKIDITAI